MSRKQWLIVGALALTDVIVLCLMGFVVVRSFNRPPVAPAPTPTATATAVMTPTATVPPTWTPTPSSTPTPQPSPTPSGTPTRTPTPWPTSTGTVPPTPTMTPTPAMLLENPSFEGVSFNDVPGWQTGAFVNWQPGEELDPGGSYAEPRFSPATDQRRWINGATLKIHTYKWVKLRAWVFQTVDVAPGSRLQFQAQAKAFVDDTAGGYLMKVGVDPAGGEGCDQAQWGAQENVNQDDGIVTLMSPLVTVGAAGRATVCMFAETQYANTYHAAYFDEAEITVRSSGE